MVNEDHLEQYTYQTWYETLIWLKNSKSISKLKNKTLTYTQAPSLKEKKMKFQEAIDELIKAS